MSCLRRLFLILGAICALQGVALCESKAVELRWNELSGMVAGHNVVVTLRDGATVSGEAMAVREDSLVLEIRRASNPALRKGNGAIPRDSISIIKLERSRGGWGKTIGTVIGVLSGITLGGYAAAHTNSAGAGIPVFLGVAAGFTVAGSYAGRQLDKKETLIKIVP
jgi:hypothetical protein